MTSYFNHKIFPKQNFYLQYFKGLVNMDIAGRSTLNLINDEDFDPAFNTIVDFRDAEMQFSENELSEFVNFLMRRNLVDKNRKIALLTENRDELFFKKMFNLLAENKVTNYEIFETLEASMKWVEVKKSKGGMIQSEIEKLKAHS